MSRILNSALKACLLSILAVSLRADTLNYDFTYSGTGTGPSTAVGSGSFSLSYTPGSATGTLTAFSFSDTFTSSTYGDSTFSYSGLADVASSTIVLSTTNPQSLATATISTDYEAGTNSGYGPVNFNLGDSAGTIFDSTMASDPSEPDFLAGFTSGGGTVTLAPAATPEPTTMGLCTLAAVAGVVLFRRRRTA